MIPFEIDYSIKIAFVIFYTVGILNIMLMSPWQGSLLLIRISNNVSAVWIWEGGPAILYSTFSYIKTTLITKITQEQTA